jgi:hypothetical protein
MAQHTVVVEQAPSEEKKKRKKLPLILAGVGILALVPLVGSTFAANISLNGGTTPVEFGQGTVNAAACDSNIKVGLSSDIVNTGSSNVFALGTITLVDNGSGSSLPSLCAGKTITIRLADYLGNLLELGPVDSTQTVLNVAINGAGTTATVTSGVGGAYTGSGDITDGTITISRGSANLFHDDSSVIVHSADVAQVLLESKDS